MIRVSELLDLLAAFDRYQRVQALGHVEPQADLRTEPGERLDVTGRSGRTRHGAARRTMSVQVGRPRASSKGDASGDMSESVSCKSETGRAGRRGRSGLIAWSYISFSF